jgi:hypothetical protein
MLFFISRAQAIDNVILMQSLTNVGFNKLCKLTICMCENWFQQNQTNMAGIHLMKYRFKKNQTKKAGNWLQTCSDIFCGKYISMKIGSKKINQARQEEIHLSWGSNKIL